MVFASICEHARTAFYFASTNSDQICLASSEHLKKYNWRAASTSQFFSLAATLLLIFSVPGAPGALHNSSQ